MMVCGEARESVRASRHNVPSKTTKWTIRAVSPDLASITIAALDIGYWGVAFLHLNPSIRTRARSLSCGKIADTRHVLHKSRNISCFLFGEAGYLSVFHRHPGARKDMPTPPSVFVPDVRCETIYHGYVHGFMWRGEVLE